MNSETWFESLSSVAEQLKQIDPDPAQTDWLRQRAELDRVQAALEQLARGQREAMEALPEEEQASVRTSASQILCAAASLLHAAGRRREALALLPELRTLAEGTSEAPIARALGETPEEAVRLNRAWWLLRNKRRREAQRLAEPLTKSPIRAIADNYINPVIRIYLF